MLRGSLHSSAMLTESSNPTMAKKASVVAAITDQNAPPIGAVLNCVTRDTSPWPAPIAHRPMTMMISRPVSSTQVSTTLAFTLSPTPRKLTIATSAMKARPTQRDADAAGEPEAEGIGQVGREGARRGRCRGDARAHHREGDDEGDEVDAERPMRIERGAGGARVLRHQLEVAEGGDHAPRRRRPGTAATPRRPPAWRPGRSAHRCRCRGCRRR